MLIADLTGEAMSIPYLPGFTRLRLDTALYEPAPPRKPPQMVRPRLKGRRLPTLAAVAADPSTPWTTITVANWYGARGSLAERTVEVVSSTAVWYHTGLPPVPIRRVLFRDPQGNFGPPGPAVHRPRRCSRADPVVVRLALAETFAGTLTRSTFADLGRVVGR
jgi:hypothetical protein